MSSRISRRSFFNKTVSLGTGALMFKYIPAWGAQKKGIMPMIITSKDNETGQRAMEAGWEILVKGGSALDAVEVATNIIELDPEDTTVGYGGLPNEDGVVQLDASIMDGKTYNAGGVGCLENIVHPSSVARKVMERTDHVLLVGEGARDFALKWGFKEEDLLSEKARKIWLRWKENNSDRETVLLKKLLRDIREDILIPPEF